MADTRPIEDRHPLIARVGRAMLGWRDLGPGVVVAVSGGGDSVFLLKALAEVGPELGLRLSAAHLDHGVRGEEAKADARFVADLAESLKIPLDLGEWTPHRPGGFEASARAARYEWLLGVAGSRGASSVAVGHSKDDQAETILHRILRGTGTRGLAGMPGRRKLSESVDLIRPILDCGREEIREYLDQIRQEYRFDSSNEDISRTRARIRLDLLPKLAGEYNPGVVDALVRLGKIAGDDQKRSARRIEKAARSAIVAANSEGVVLLRDSLDRLSKSLRAEVIREAWRRAGWPEGEMDAGRWLRLANLDAEFRGRFSVGSGIDAWVGDDSIRMAPTEAIPSASRPEFARLPIPGFAAWMGGRIGAWIGAADPVDECVDLDQIEPWPGDGGWFLIVSGPAAGDRFAPLGMDGRGMALADFLRGRKVPIGLRGEIPIVRDAKGIVWVAGHRIAERVKRTGATTRLLGLDWDRGGGDRFGA